MKMTMKNAKARLCFQEKRKKKACTNGWPFTKDVLPPFHQERISMQNIIFVFALILTAATAQGTNQPCPKESLYCDIWQTNNQYGDVLLARGGSYILPDKISCHGEILFSPRIVWNDGAGRDPRLRGISYDITIGQDLTGRIQVFNDRSPTGDYLDFGPLNEKRIDFNYYGQLISCSLNPDLLPSKTK
jgi:hypothetical protein